MQYSYQAINEAGHLVKGMLDASDYRHAARQLEGQGLSVVALVEELAEPLAKKRFRRSSISRNEVILVCYELVTMLRAGVSLREGVEALADSEHSEGLVLALGQMLLKLRGGASFSESLKAAEIPLPDYVFYLVEAGEMTGKLADALEQGVGQMEYDLQVANDTRSALIYPAILVLSGIIAVGIMFLFVVPKFASLMDASAEMPLLATMVLGTGLWVSENLPLLGGVTVLFCILLVLMWRNESMRVSVLNLVSRTPVLGDWVNETDIAIWAKMLGVLLQNRVSLLDALRLSAKASRIPWRKMKLSLVSRKVKGGVSLSSALAEEQVITSTALNLVIVGERAGDLPTTLASVGRLYDQASKNRMKSLLSLIEPLAILVIGSAIGVIILGVILAITSANDIAV